jgi:hypothetical protein
LRGKWKVEQAGNEGSGGRSALRRWEKNTVKYGNLKRREEEMRRA